MGLSAVIGAMQDAIQLDLTNANAVSPLGAPWEIIPGYQLSEDLSVTQGQASGVLIMLYPLKAKRDMRYLNAWYEVTPPAVGLIATVSGNSVTFSGTVSAGLNIHAVLASGADKFARKDALYQTTGTGGLNSVAAGVAAAITAQGYSASSSGPTATMTTGALQTVNVGGTGTISYESNRTLRLIQASIYAPNPDLRAAFSDAMMSGALGSTGSPFLSLPDGSAAYVKAIGDDWLEPAQLSYSLYQASITYSVEYMLENIYAATQIGAAEAIQVYANNAPVTLFTGD